MDEKIKKRIQYLSLITFIFSIVHLIGILFFQSSIDLKNNSIKSLTSVGSLFGTSQFIFSLMYNLNNLTSLKAVVSISTIAIALILIFSSYFAFKKNYKLNLISIIIYFIDLVFSIIGLILCVNYNINISLPLYIVFIILHFVFLITLIIYFILCIKYNNND